MIITKKFVYENRIADELIFVYKNKIIYKAAAVWQMDLSDDSSDYILRAMFSKLAADKKPENLQVIGLYHTTSGHGQYWQVTIGRGGYIDESEFIKELKDQIQISEI